MSKPSEIKAELKDSNKVVRSTIEMKGRVRYRLFQLSIRNNLPMGEVLEALLNLYEDHPELGSFHLQERQSARNLRRAARSANRKAINRASNEQLVQIDKILHGPVVKEMAE